MKILYNIDYLCFLCYNQIKLILKLVREEISMSNVQIYVIHHDGENYPTFESENIIPILAGNPVRDGYRISLRDTAGGACITDPEKQDIYSEFTAYYYIWKNMMPKDKKGYVGVMHYRSFLNLSEAPHKTYPSLESRFGYETEKLNAYFENIIPESYSGQRVPAVMGGDAVVSEPLWFSQGIYKQYDQCHPMADILFEKARDLLSRKNNPEFPDMENYFDEHFSMRDYAGKGGYGYFKCLLVSTWEYFDAYCRFIFYLLDSLYDDSDVLREMQKYQMIKGADRPETQKKTRFRLLAFFAERMTSFFVGYAIKSGIFRVGVAPRYHYTSMKELVQDVYPSKPEEHLAPMMRAYSIQEQDHMAVADLKELDTMGEKGYFCEGPLGYIYTQQVAGSSPVYRVLKKNGEHYITQDINRERKQSSYKSHKLLGYSKNAPNAANNETLHLEQYVLVGLAGGPVPTINPSEFDKSGDDPNSKFCAIGYDPNRPYAAKMKDLGYLVDIWGRK